MFEKYTTYELLELLNFLIRDGKQNQYANLFNEAIYELESRSKLLAMPFIIKRDANE